MQDGVSKAKKQRQYDKLPVIICEWHQQVLPHIHRAIATRYLPENGLKMLHFDSHPDLTFPINLPAEECFEKESLYEEVEIADWILPLVYEGHLDHVVWIKPPWANQIKDGDWAVSVGENKENQFLRISCMEDYFLEELLYANEEDLCNSKKLNLKIRTLSCCEKFSLSHCNLPEKEITNKEEYGKLVVNPDEEAIFNQIENICNVKKDESYILDIDLDFFSTYNPFVLRHNEEHFKEITEIYKFESPKSNSDDDIEESLQNRHEQLKKIQNTIRYFEKKSTGLQDYRTDFLNLISNDDEEILVAEICPEYLELLNRIQKKETEDGREIDLELVHFAGMSSELPHHRSTEKEIEQLVLNVEELLTSQPRPTLVTIARSSEDEYMPPDQVEFVQEKVISMLERLYNHLSVVQDYTFVNTDD